MDDDDDDAGMKGRVARGILRGFGALGRAGDAVPDRPVAADAQSAVLACHWRGHRIKSVSCALMASNLRLKQLNILK